MVRTMDETGTDRTPASAPSAAIGPDFIGGNDLVSRSHPTSAIHKVTTKKRVTRLRALNPTPLPIS